jgi:FAD/FMN-containing dehydrogenase
MRPLWVAPHGRRSEIRRERIRHRRSAFRSSRRMGPAPTVVGVTDLDRLRGALDGVLLTPGSPAYDAVRRPADARYVAIRPRIVVRCASTADVARTIAYARAAELPVVPRGGGHCFAGRSSTTGVLLDLSTMDSVVSDAGTATIGAGARLVSVYTGLHAAGRTIPAGCGPTVGIAGLALGGGIGLLGRTHGLTCDRLVGATVVLADGSVVDCADDREPALFWALRGAGGGQFGVVTALRFATVAEPVATRFEWTWSSGDLAAVIAAWQDWAPEAPDGLTAALTVVAEPDAPPRAVLFGAALGESVGLAREFAAGCGAGAGTIRGGLPYSALKGSFAEDPAETGVRIRSEFVAGRLRPATIDRLLAALTERPDETRRLTFTPLGGAYNRVAPDATAFAHRDQRFLLEQAAPPTSDWLDRSWDIAHADGSGRVYPNFPDPALPDAPAAYHGGNLGRLAAVKQEYDPERVFTFPQSL